MNATKIKNDILDFLNHSQQHILEGAGINHEQSFKLEERLLKIENDINVIKHLIANHFEIDMFTQRAVRILKTETGEESNA